MLKRMIFPGLAMIGLIALVSIAGCSKNGADADKAAVPEAETVTMPTSPTDTAAWKKYLASVVMQNMQGVKTNRPYMYFIPSGDDAKAVSDRANQLENVQGVVARSVLPGNMMAFGGPDSKTTADFAIQSFAEARPGTFKDVVVLVIAKPEDTDRIKAALSPSGADVRVAEMK